MNSTNNNNLYPSLAPTAVPTASVKVHLNDEARRFPFPINSDADQFAVFVNLVRESFSRVLAGAPFKLTYVDDENDRVTIGSHLELAAAVDIAARSQSILRITVVPQETAIATAVAPTSAVTTTSTTTTPACEPSPLPSDVPHCQRGFAHHGHAYHGHAHHGHAHHGHAHRGWHHKFEHLRTVYATQLAALEAQGLTEAPVNIRLLRKFDGDIDAVANHLRNGGGAVGGCARRWHDPEFESKYAAELERLQATGAPRFMCMRVLRKCGGDATLAETKIQKKIAKFGGVNPFARDPEFEAKHAADIDRLQTSTGVPRCICVRVLRRFNGDVEQATEKLTKKKAKFEQRHGKFAARLAQQDPEFESKYAAELERLQATGAPRFMCMRVLRRFNGDVERAEAKIQKKIAKFGGVNPFARDPEFEAKHAADIEHLQTSTGCPRWVCIRFLRRFNGDVAQATEKLTKKKAKFEKRHGKCEARSFPSVPDHEFETKYATELQQLQSNTGAPQFVCARLLRKFNGDVARAEAKINKRRAKLGGVNPFERDFDFETQHAADIERLQESTGIPRFACANVLRRFDGNVEKAAIKINKKKAKLEKRHAGFAAKFAAKQARKAEKQARKTEKQARKAEKCNVTAAPATPSDRFAAERQQLADMGFERGCRINRLLEKHNGDISNVIADLLARGSA